MTTTQTDSEKQAQAQYEHIEEMVKAWEEAGDDDEKRDNAEFVIHADALSVEVRSGWWAPGLHVRGDERANRPAEYMILLCTGGPAVRIIGTLDGHGEPDTARIQHQDWGTPWTDYRLDSEQEQTVLTYARCFYYGE